MIRVVAPSRLHFGLFRVPVAGDVGTPARAFGGVGLMVEHPGLAVTVRPADSWQFEGALASRAQVFAMRFMASLPEERRRPFQVLVERCPPEHTGLGVGTQLGLAVAKALATASGEGEQASAALAPRVGRGERSAIGVHGFDRGGLLVDAGKEPGEAVSPLLAHVAPPEAWRVVLFTPPGAGALARPPRAAGVRRGDRRPARSAAAARRNGHRPGRAARRPRRLRRRGPRVQPQGRRAVPRRAGRRLRFPGSRRADRRRARERGARRRAKLVGADRVRGGARQRRRAVTGAAVPRAGAVLRHPRLRRAPR